MEKKKQSPTKITFEKALEELEDIARLLESGELGLEESISKYETGMKLAKFCNDKLEEAEQKIEILQKGKNNSIEKKKITVDHESGEIDDEDELQGSLL